MKKAIMALDGGGSNLRMVVADYDSEQPIYFNEVNTGTNLSTVPNRQEAINNIKSLVLEGFGNLPEGYEIAGIGLSSAGTEIKQNVIDLNNALVSVTEQIKKPTMKSPALFVTNDIEVLLHSSDMALVAGTGTVGAVKYKDIKPYDNTDVEPEEYTIGENINTIGDNPFIECSQLKTITIHSQNSFIKFENKANAPPIKIIGLLYVVFNVFNLRFKGGKKVIFIW